jgi:hypothetical protein
MGKDTGDKRSKIFPGKGDNKPVVEEDKTKEATEAVSEKQTKPDKYKGKHEK